jgi:hypothetical protein
MPKRKIILKHKAQPNQLAQTVDIATCLSLLTQPTSMIQQKTLRNGRIDKS